MASVRARTEPWMSGDILNAIKLRNKIFSEHNKTRDKTKTEPLPEKFRKQRNVVTNMITKAKKNFLNENTETNKKTSRKINQSIKLQQQTADQNYKLLHYFRWRAHH